MENIDLMLKQILERLTSIEDILKSSPKESSAELPLRFSNRNVTSQLEIDESAIEHLVDIHDGDFKIIKKIPGDSIPIKQLNATILILTINTVFLKTEYISSIKLKEKISSLGISTVNINRTLKKAIEYIVPKGKPSSHEYSYRITTPGILKGKSLIKEILI